MYNCQDTEKMAFLLKIVASPSRWPIKAPLCKIIPRWYPKVCEGLGSLHRAWRDHQMKEIRSIHIIKVVGVACTYPGVIQSYSRTGVTHGDVEWFVSRTKTLRNVSFGQSAICRRKYVSQVCLWLQDHTGFLWMSSSGSLIINLEQLHFRLFLSGHANLLQSEVRH